MRTSVITAAAFLALGSGGAQAEQEAGRRLLEEQARSLEAEQVAADARGASLERARPGPVEETPCFDVARIDVTGATLLSPEALSAETERFAGRCLGRESVSNLLEVISAAYAERGYITTRAYAPEQDIADGSLLVEVLEGRIEGFVYTRLEDDGAEVEGRMDRLEAAMPIKAGDVFELRALEHGLEQMNRLPSTQASANLSPGEAPGTSIVTVKERSADRWRGSVRLDNSGGEGTGQERLTLALEADDVLGMSDMWSISYAGSLETNAIAWNASVPNGWWEFSTWGSYAEEAQALTAQSDLFSQTLNFGAQAERLLFRDDRVRLRGFLSLAQHSGERFVNIAPLTPQRRTTMRAGLRALRYGEDWTVSGELGASMGVALFGADQDAPGLQDDAPRAKFHKLDFRVSAWRRLGTGSLSLSAWGQTADQPLYSADQMSVGGWSTVRGFAGKDVAGDSALVMRAEYQFQPWTASPLSSGEAEKSLLRLSMQPYAFVDAGATHSAATGENNQMMGAGIGLNLAIGRASWTLTAAVPMAASRGRDLRELQGFVSVTFKAF